MVKFRCQRCSQKIAVDDPGIGVAITCPTCAEQLIVPLRTDSEFAPRNGEAVSLEFVPEAPPVPRVPWSRLILERLLPALLAQRRDLMQTQDEAAEQIAAFEQRVVLLQMKFQRRLSFFQERIATLEADNRELSRQLEELSERPVRPLASFGAGRVNLRDAGFLLRT